MRGAESYLHRFAKQTLASWLRGGIRVGPKFQGLQPLMACIPISGCSAPMFNVYEEYPIATCGGGTNQEVGCSRRCAEQCSHPTAWHCFAASNSISTPAHKHGIPTGKELTKCPSLKRTNFLFDVAMVGADGSLKCVFEICHTNPIEAQKIKWLTEHNVPWFEMSADWIMKQCRSPYSVAEGILRSSSAAIAVQEKI